MKIDDKLLSEITEYCKYNDISDIEKEVNKMLQKGFNIEKYGYSPFQNVVEFKEEIPLKQEKIKIEEEHVEELKKVEKPKRKVRIIKNN